MNDHDEIRAVWDLTKQLLQNRLTDIAVAKDQLDEEAAKIIKMLGGNRSTSGKRRGRPPKATKALKKTTKKAVAAPDAEAGMKAVAHLKEKAGEWITSAALAELTGVARIGAAIKATGEKFESKGPGRAKLYRIKE